MAIELIPITRVPDDPQIILKGNFLAGTTALFFFSFPDLMGELFDPSDCNYTITTASGTEVATGDSADKLEKGQYVFSWDIPEDTTPGLYIITITYTVEQIDGPTEGSISESFVVGETETSIIPVQTIAFRRFVESLIGYAQRIPIFNEVARLNKERTIGLLSFPRWNQPSGVKVYINGDLKPTGFESDYLKGQIIFDRPLAQVDEVNVSYNFRWFTDDEIDSFVAQAVQTFNQYQPHTGYLIINLPPTYGITVAQQAAIYCIRRLLIDYTYQEPAKIIGADRIDKVISSLESLKKNYEEELKALYEQKKFIPYIGRTKTITTPAINLPGGRSRWARLLFKGGI